MPNFMQYASSSHVGSEDDGDGDGGDPHELEPTPEPPDDSCDEYEFTHDVEGEVNKAWYLSNNEKES